MTDNSTEFEWVLGRVREFGDAIMQCEKGWEGKEIFKIRSLTQLQAVPADDGGQSWKMQYVPYIPAAFKIIPNEMKMLRSSILYHTTSVADGIGESVQEVWAQITKAQSSIEIARDGGIPPRGPSRFTR